MINLQQALGEDIAAGISAAQGTGDIPDAQDLPPIVVERPKQPGRGDYATPVALAIGQKVSLPPMEVVEKIAEHMPKKEYIGKIEAAEPGFLNVYLSLEWLRARLDDISETSLCVDVSQGQQEHLNLEFVSANPTGPPTLGNIRTAFTVDTLANVLECAGHAVTREYYINDHGGQIMRLGESVIRRTLQSRGESIEYPEDMYQGDYIKEVATRIEEDMRENEGKECTAEDLEDKAVLDAIGQQAATLILGRIRHALEEDMKIKMDVWTSERQLREEGVVDAVVAKLREAGVTYKKEEAEYLKTTDYGDTEDRILVKSDGDYAYIAPDIAYHQNKYDRQFTGIYTYVGADHQGHAPKLYAAMQALGNDPRRLHVITAQWMRMVKGGQPVKLSKRAGNIIEPRELIDEIGYDAARFFMVQHALTTHMDLDLDLAKEQSERNPVFYVQYAYVRLQSILRRAKEEDVIKELGERVEVEGPLQLKEDSEIALMKELFRFPETVSSIAQNMEVQALAYYAHELARAIHLFYNQVSVLQEEDEATRISRLQLVIASRTVLQRTLKLLGISQPDIM